MLLAAGIGAGDERAAGAAGKIGDTKLTPPPPPPKRFFCAMIIVDIEKTIYARYECQMEIILVCAG